MATKGTLDQGEEKEMSFLDHLEELRWHVVRSVLAIILVSVVLFIFPEFLFKHVIFAPTTTEFWTFRKLCALSTYFHSDLLCFEAFPFELQSRQMMGQFMMHMTASIVGGFILTFPYVFWEIWRFIAPGLYSHERREAQGAVFYVTLLFVIGVSFGYFVVTPVAVQFFANYSVYDAVQNQFDITNYVSTIVILVMGSGLLFQLPIVVYFLSRVGIVTPELMRKYRRHSIVVIFILAAIITPPDPFTQTFVGLPLIGLYQLSIFISARVQRQMKKRELQKTDANA